MKIALILPPVTLEERYNKAISYVAGSLPPLGLLSIGTMLKNAGHSVIVLDGTILPLDDILKEVQRFKPHIAGITAMTMMWPKVRILGQQLKERWPQINVIAGGVHTSIIKEKALEEIPSLDAVCWGEGEYSVLEYVERLGSSDLERPLAGMALRRKDGSIAVGPNREPIADLDTLPIPNRALISLRKYTGALEQYRRLPVTNMVTTRGCPFKCIFCLPNLLGEGVRYRSADKVVEEIEYLINGFGVKDIAFWDDTFTLNRERVFEICEQIIAKKIKFIWSAQARADCVTAEMLKVMARAGCWKIFFGVESLLQKNLDFLQKGETVEEIFNAVKLAKRFRIKTEGSYIFGIPGETFQEGLETIRMAIKLDTDYAKFYALCPYGHLYSDIERYGALLSSDESKYSGASLVFVPFSMKEFELKRLLYIAYRKFYVRPGMVYKRIKEIFNPLELRKSLRGFLTIITFIFEEVKHRIRYVYC